MQIINVVANIGADMFLVTFEILCRNKQCSVMLKKQMAS